VCVCEGILEWDEGSNQEEIKVGLRLDVRLV